MLPRFYTIAKVFTNFIINLIGLASNEFIQQVLLSQSLKIDHHLLLLTQFASTLRNFVLPAAPGVTSMSFRECDLLVSDVCWAISNLIYKIQTPEMVQSLIQEGAVLKQINGIVGVLDNSDNTDYFFDHELLQQIVTLFCAITSFLPDKESES